jgi:hypothetical protein
MRATCPAHLTIHHLITAIIPVNSTNHASSSPCSVLQSPFTSAPNKMPHKGTVTAVLNLQESPSSRYLQWTPCSSPVSVSSRVQVPSPWTPTLPTFTYTEYQTATSSKSCEYSLQVGSTLTAHGHPRSMQSSPIGVFWWRQRVLGHMWRTGSVTESLVILVADRHHACCQYCMGHRQGDIRVYCSPQEGMRDLVYTGWSIQSARL